MNSKRRSDKPSRKRISKKTPVYKGYDGKNLMNVRRSRLEDSSPDKHQVSRQEDWWDIEREMDEDWE